MRSAILANLLITTALLAAAANAGCPSMCTCSDSLVSCRSELLEGVPNFESLEVEPETIDLSDNSIFSILATDFSFDGVENVQYLFLNNNHIVDIHETAFSELRNVREINLNTNSLDNVPPMFVADNKQLVSLDLSNNFFDVETPEIYSESLEVLDLSSTKIFSFSEANIKFLPNLKVINLSYNRLKAIEPSVFENLPNLLAVDLTGNFWNCDQKTIDLFNFLTDKGFTDVQEPVKCITEDGFYQDIYTSRGPVDIFSISLEGFAEESPKEDEEAAKVEEPVAQNDASEKIDYDDVAEAVNADDINNDASENVYENDGEEALNEETANENAENVEAAINEDESENTKKEEAVVNDETAEQNDDDEKTGNNNDESVDDNYLKEEIQDDNQEALYAENLQATDEANDEKSEENLKVEDKTLQEMILQQTGKKDPEEITDSDIIDAINELLKEEDGEDIDDYGEDYWDEPEKPEETPADEAENKEEEEEAVEQAKKIIEEEEKKEEAEEPSQAPEVGISVIREDQYIVLLERDSSDESQYGIYFRNNIVSMLGIMAFVLTFITGIFFGFFAIREAFARRRRRDMHGSTNVLISKWSQDLA